MRIGVVRISPWLLLRYSEMGSIGNPGGIKSMRTSTTVSACAVAFCIDSKLLRDLANFMAKSLDFKVKSTKSLGRRTMPKRPKSGYFLLFYFFMDGFYRQSFLESAYYFEVFYVIKYLSVSDPNTTGLR